MADKKKVLIKGRIGGGRVKGEHTDCGCWGNVPYGPTWEKTCPNEMKRLVGRVQSPLLKKRSSGR